MSTQSLTDKPRRAWWESPWLPFAALFLVYWLFSLGIEFNFSDDAQMYHELAQNGILNTVLAFRETWSGRIVIELVYFNLYYAPLWLWRILNALMFPLAAYSMARLLGVQKQTPFNWVVCGVTLLYPLTEMISAGWISSSHNYLWPLALGLYAFTPWMAHLRGERVPWYTKLLAIPALVYAANEEQVMALLLGFAAIAAVYMLATKRKWSLYHALWLAVLAGMVALWITAPGPSLRTEAQVGFYYKDFYKTNLLMKLYNAFMLLSNHFLGAGNVPLLLLGAVCCMAVWGRHRDTALRVIAAVPLAAGLAMGPLYPATSELFPAVTLLTESPLTYENFSSVYAYVPFVYYVVVWLCLLVSVYLAFEGEGEGLVFALVLAAGVCSQLMLAFSPSIYASAPRTFIYMHFALLAVAAALMCGFYQNGKTRHWRHSRVLLGLLSAFSVLSLFLSV